MAKLRVWVRYKPRIYSDLFSVLLRSVQGVEVLDYENPASHADLQKKGNGYEEIDLVVFCLDEICEPDLGQIGNLFPEAKLIAFSPTGDYGLRRQPGEEIWDEVSPYGVSELLEEIRAEVGENGN